MGEPKKEHGEEPTTGLKASLLLEMPPDQVRPTVVQGFEPQENGPRHAGGEDQTDVQRPNR